LAWLFRQVPKAPRGFEKDRLRGQAQAARIWKYQRLNRVFPEWALRDFAINHAAWRYIPAKRNEAYFAAQAKAIREATPADLLSL
jgi:hypothetical protein